MLVLFLWSVARPPERSWKYEERRAQTYAKLASKYGEHVVDSEL